MTKLDDRVDDAPFFGIANLDGWPRWVVYACFHLTLAMCRWVGIRGSENFRTALGLGFKGGDGCKPIGCGGAKDAVEVCCLRGEGGEGGE